MSPVESYLQRLRDIRLTGAGVPETSYYGALEALLNEVGDTLRPRVRCVLTLQNRGAGLPDGGLFTTDQIGTGLPFEGVLPSRGAIEVKPTSDDVSELVAGEQVGRYARKYGQVLATNYRDWALVARDAGGATRLLETFRLAESEERFWETARHPRTLAAEHGAELVDYLKRVMLWPAPIVEPEDLAWLLASYAREALQRIEAVGLATLGEVRSALEEALGIRFEGERGEHFFRSTLIQTLFYGIFSAWVLWSRQAAAGRFDWRLAQWTLRVPMIRALFERLAVPSKLSSLGIIQVLDWTVAALDRVDRDAFFERFELDRAVQYFYEPFLEAFDPELRKELGVWYTPPEVVRYMVARVDQALRDDLGVPDGLADSRVYVLDPCCGTGTYLVEVLERIAVTLRQKGEDALIAAELQRAASERVFGFEILPAPFVVAHLQLGLFLHNLGTTEAEYRRVGVYLTNALTGWTAGPDEEQPVLISELQSERDAAEHIKRDVPILVILGNPPYNGFAGMAVGEEHDLVEAYRTTVRAPKPQGQGLNDLYVRFYRMAERRIAEMTGRGIVCFISNYSWLDGLSFTGMRERYLEAFDRITIDSLNGDKYRTGKLTPAGAPDPSIFSTERNREGIQVGTAIALLVRTEPHTATAAVTYRDFWGRHKRKALLELAGLAATTNDGHQIEPVAELGPILFT